MPTRKKIHTQQGHLRHLHIHVPLSTALTAVSVATIIAVTVPVLLYARDLIPESQRSFLAPAKIDGTPVTQNPYGAPASKAQIAHALSELKKIDASLATLTKRATQSNSKIDPTLTDELASMREEVKRFSADLVAPPSDTSAQEVYSDYMNAQLPGTLETLRARIELPFTLNAMDADIKKAQSLLASSKLLSLPGIDEESFKATLADQQNAYYDSKAKLEGEDFDGAHSTLASAQQHGWLASGIAFLASYGELQKTIKSLKDAGTQNSIQEVAAPIASAFNEGNFEPARAALADLAKETRAIIKKYRLDAGDSKAPAQDIESRMAALEKTITSKLQIAGQPAGQ